jgi:hypothetical protein
MNYNNLAQKTNFTAGSEALELLPFYLTSVSLPGINFSYPDISGRSGAKLNLAGDSITYNALSFEILIDEDFKIFHEFMDKVTANINPKSGSFSDNSFDFWIEINNSKGFKIMKYEFTNCRIESIGDISLETQDDSTEHSMNVEIKYDYYEIIKSDRSIPTINS